MAQSVAHNRETDRYRRSSLGRVSIPDQAIPPVLLGGGTKSVGPSRPEIVRVGDTGRVRQRPTRDKRHLSDALVTRY